MIHPQQPTGYYAPPINYNPPYYRLPTDNNMPRPTTPSSLHTITTEKHDQVRIP